MKYSIIDISSSSLSMIVAEIDGAKAEIVFKDRVPLFLFPHFDGKNLSEHGLNKLTGALKEFQQKCAQFHAERCYVISTAALRLIENFDEVQKTVEEKLSLPVNFLDGATEAYCDLAANAYYQTYERAVLVDLGGKSIEICDFSKNAKEEMAYLDFGLLDLNRKYVKKLQPDENEAKEIKKYIKGRFDEAGIPKKGAFSTVVLVGATNCAVYDVYADYAKCSREEESKIIDRKTFKNLTKNLLVGADRSSLILNNAPEKLFLIGPAAIVLRNLFKRFDADNIVVSERGVKEGYLQLILDGKESGRYYDFTSDRICGGEKKRRGRPKKIADTEGEQKGSE